MKSRQCALQSMTRFLGTTTRESSTLIQYKGHKPLLDEMDKNGTIMDWMVEKVAPLIF